jgi:hypothetical protein
MLGYSRQCRLGHSWGLEAEPGARYVCCFEPFHCTFPDAPYTREFGDFWGFKSLRRPWRFKA